MKAQNKMELRQSCVADEESTCSQCGGIVLCNRWCKSVNPFVRYAYDAVLHPDHLSSGDRIILHALGVRWNSERNKSKRQCASTSKQFSRIVPKSDSHVSEQATIGKKEHTVGSPERHVRGEV